MCEMWQMDERCSWRRLNHARANAGHCYLGCYCYRCCSLNHCDQRYGYCIGSADGDVDCNCYYYDNYDEDRHQLLNDDDDDG